MPHAVWIVILFVGIVVAGLAGYHESRTKVLQIQRSADERGEALSDDELATMEKYRLAKERSLMTIALGAVACFFFLLLAK